MAILSVSQLNKSYGVNPILENISFHIENGDRVGLIGANGAGKTTLFNILTGQIKPDSGNLYMPKDIKIGYLKQRDLFDQDLTVKEEIDGLFANIKLLEADIKNQTEKIAEAGEAADGAMWERLDHLNRRFLDEGGYTYESKARGILKSMAFGEEVYDQKISSMSGGEKTRLALAKLLIENPDILFLDEPTNHLDLGTLNWLEQYLASYKGTLMVISHDRYFLDRIVSHIFELRNHRLTVYTGNYSDYAKRSREIFESELKAYQKQREEIRRQEDIIRRYKQRVTEKLAKRAASREKSLAKVELLEKPVKEQDPVKISFKQKIKSGRDVIKGENLSKTFTETRGKRIVSKSLFSGVNFDIKRGERICIVGANGVGKTTLVRMMMGELSPTTGRIKRGYHVVFGYYDQGQVLLNEDKTVIDEVHDDYYLYTDGEIRNILARFLFKADDVFKQVRDLSGGEKARLALLKLMMSEANVLVLDEPTNHLDIGSKEVFEDALSEYQGTVIAVTHDRYFLNKIPDKILELEEEGIREYLGKYDYYSAKKEEYKSGKKYLRDLGEYEANKSFNHQEAGYNIKEISQYTKEGLSEDEVGNNTESVTESETERQEKKRIDRETKKNKRMLSETEKKISALEHEIHINERRMCEEDILKDHEKLQAIAYETEEKKKELAENYKLWEKLAEWVD
jgi:ATP-binding cassette subfamily F protein 3